MPRASHLSDRQREVAFGLGLLVPVALLLSLAEGAARLYMSNLREAGTDWSELIKAVGIDEGSYVRFRPNSQAGHLAFNDQGFRGPALPLPAPEGTVRIAFLGDSKVLSASLPEAATLAAQTTALLTASLPNCRFDYVTMAGPSYDMDTLATLWSTHAPTLQPDLAVVLAGSVTDLIAEHDAAAWPEDRLRQSRGVEPTAASQPERLTLEGLGERSALVSLVGRSLILASPAMTAIETSDLPWDALTAAYKEMAATLVDATSDVPVLAVGYRSRLRADQAVATRVQNSRETRAEVPGMSVEAATALNEFVPEQLRQVAADAGWVFLDPIRAIPGDDTAFMDATHFSEAGLTKLAKMLTTEIAPMVDEACKI